MYVPSERVSVVVMFNHLSDAHDAAVDVLAAVLGEERPPPAAAPPHPTGSAPIPSRRPGSRSASMRPTARCVCVTAIFPDRLDLQPDGTASSDDGSVRLRPGDGGLWMDRPHENQSSRLRPCDGAPAKDVAGRYRCEELDAELTVVDAGGVLYGGFSGFLGQGRMELLGPVGADVWVLPCPRALDHTPPGDWTLAFRRDASGRGRRRRGRLLAGPPPGL